MINCEPLNFDTLIVFTDPLRWKSHSLMRDIILISNQARSHTSEYREAWSAVTAVTMSDVMMFQCPVSSQSSSENMTTDQCRG